MDTDVYDMTGKAKAKTISYSFDEQLDAAEELYGRQIEFSFNGKDVDNILQKADIYDGKIINRVGQIVRGQMRKYAYLFK